MRAISNATGIDVVHKGMSHRQQYQLLINCIMWERHQFAVSSECSAVVLAPSLSRSGSQYRHKHLRSWHVPSGMSCRNANVGLLREDMSSSAAKTGPSTTTMLTFWLSSLSDIMSLQGMYPSDEHR